MEDYNDIDKLLQKKLENFVVSPKPQVWQNIEQELQKKKRRVLPMWWIYGGAAALLILGLFLLPVFIKEQSKIPINNEQIIVLQPEDEIKKILNETKKLDDIKTKIVNSNTTDNTRKVLTKNEQNNLIAEQELSNLSQKKDTIKDKESTNDNNEGLNLVDKNAMEKIFIAAHEKEINTKDSVLTTRRKKDFIAEMAKNDSIIPLKKHRRQWSLAPVVASIKSNSFSGSSPLGDSFKGTEIDGNSTVSFGVKIAYQLNNRWAVQSGIHIQNIGYTTKSITIASSGFVKDDSSAIVFSDNSSIESVSATPGKVGINQSGIISSNAQLEQSLRYIEIPIEVKYTFFRSKKFNTSFVTGFSSLILDSNSIEAKASNFSKTLGEASNLNDISFSGNLGLDFNYSFNEKWTLNLNPMFKTQINTFSKGSNGFKPYSIGIYTGFTYKF
ncbi:outer membrane beta-barrel protein [Tenacibaculum sp.]|nr:outer membrane beta-barrel protein [Tenacibaculum sp.]